MNLWPVEHLFPPFFQISTDLEKVFNWSEVHLYRSNFLQSPYFNNENSGFFFWFINQLIWCYS